MQSAPGATCISPSHCSNTHLHLPGLQSNPGSTLRKRLSGHSPSFPRGEAEVKQRQRSPHGDGGSRGQGKSCSQRSQLRSAASCLRLLYSSTEAAAFQPTSATQHLKNSRVQSFENRERTLQLLGKDGEHRWERGVEEGLRVFLTSMARTYCNFRKKRTKKIHGAWGPQSS